MGHPARKLTWLQVRHLLGAVNGTRADPANGDAPLVLIVVQVGDLAQQVHTGCQGLTLAAVWHTRPQLHALEAAMLHGEGNAAIVRSPPVLLRHCLAQQLGRTALQQLH